MNRPFRVTAALAAAVVALSAATVTRATTMSAPANLAKLVHDASVIVSGTVSSVRTARTGQLNHVEITLDVARDIRGNVGRTFTFRQIGLAAPEGRGQGRTYIGGVPGLPQYREGEQVLLFLGPESHAGFRTTVGLGQGKFDYAAGNVQNETANRGLFNALSMSKAASLTPNQSAMLDTTKGFVAADAFVGLVETAVRENWWGSPTVPPGTGGGTIDDGVSLNKPVKKAVR
ncbi:MAG TPA: hypothetical protein VJ826_14355 [Candidatus Polarisedimenticolaceae bacterium]|nr:hypothetical protein [Candidatus Polarisedimenticolaceae bacterium]